MSQVICYLERIGGELLLATVHPTPEYLKRNRGDVSKLVPKGVSSKIIDASEIPEDRTFRSAWTIERGKFGYDMSNAKKIQFDRIRGVRDSKWNEADSQANKAQDEADVVKQRKIARYRQQLRDAPQSVASEIETAKTIEELKAVWPEVLK